MQSSRIPPLLDRVLSIPHQDSLILLTSVLGATTNWLIVRYLYSCLASHQPSLSRHNPGDDHPPLKVVLVTWLRDAEFWKTEVKRAVGIDLARLAVQGRFAFIDAITAVAYQPRPLGTSLVASSKGKSHFLSSPDPNHLEEVVLAALGPEKPSKDDNQGGNVVLILDAPDFLLAASDPGADGRMDLKLLQAIHRIRQHPSIRSTIVAAQTDSPLMVAPNHTTHTLTNLAGQNASPLEIAHTSFLTQLAQLASIRISLRMLDTGAAGDVSGVGRVTYGKPFTADTAGQEDGVAHPEASEWLYFVAVDGSAKAWERGSGTSVG
ncbi:hypothetical protein P152DRAFT_142953 [Eremomyces bilateralis CBS 781.70]|uniref:Uncharacterized protein n=1 Tax=Eremomyces bilateralis CBS 781.70 TaxID=1392243 RepID=A0A6G1FVU2_9PEZI|nr:uncharacterized protein P152DRAFT_142953 [Eremomyces bilateralis CBS 781.70]KAF1809904.1 hypothetical protein P152DRAFT_142953 [Eremomyces bilateralis CBS 781.70]